MIPSRLRQLPSRRTSLFLAMGRVATGSAFAIGLLSVISSAPAQTATSATAVPAYLAFSDTSETPDESAARSVLDRLAYQIASDPERASPVAASTTPAASLSGALSPAMAEQMRASRDRALAQIQGMIDKTDPAKDPEQRKQLEAALARSRESYAKLLAGSAASGSTTTSAPATSGAGELKIPAIGDRQPTFAEAIENLKKMLRDNSPPAAITAFEQSDEYKDAKLAAANAAVAVIMRRPMAALAGLLRAHELDPKRAGHLINLAGLTATFEMPRHTLALLEQAEKLIPAGSTASSETGGLKPRAVLLTNRGRALIHVRKFAEAELVLREAIRLEPTLSEAKINLAHALYQQSDTKKKEEAVQTMRFARYRRATPPVATTPTAPATPTPPATQTPAPATPEEQEAEAELVAQRGGRPPAHDLFDLSIGKAGHLPTIKIPRKIADGHAMWTKIHQLHQDTLAQISSSNSRMNELWDTMGKRRRSSPTARLSDERAKGIFWYISNAHTEPELRALFRDFNQAANDQGVGTFGGQLNNPFASHEMQGKVDEIMARTQPWEVTVQQLYDVNEEYHGSWQGPIHDFETDTHRMAKAYYKIATAIAAHLSDPVHHEYANLLIRARTLSFFAEYLSALETVARFDYDNLESWTTIRGPGQAEDGTDGDYPESDWCPAALKGEYKLKASVKIFEVSVNCEKIGFQIAAGHWVKAFAEVESTWKGDKSIFIGGAVEAALPAGPSAEAKSGLFMNVNAAGEVTDFGFKNTNSVGVSVGPVGYEREVENTFSLMAVLDSPAT